MFTADVQGLAKHTVHVLQVLVDPEAAAQSKMRKQQRRTSGKKRKMAEFDRLRSAGVPVKNKQRRAKPGDVY